jgi:hypothetical protein
LPTALPPKLPSCADCERELVITPRARQVVTGIRELVHGGSWVHDDIVPSSSGPTAFGLHDPWYYDLRRSVVRDDYSPFDEAGIPVRETADGVGQRPVLALSFGLAHLTRWVLEDDQQSAAHARRLAKWAVEEVAASPFDGAMVVRHPVPGLAEPWANALLQGLALSLIARLNAREPSAELDEALRSAVRPFDRSIRHGGLRDQTDGVTWFEEYPFSGGGSHVLNGFIYSLWGLRDAANSGIADARQHYDEGLASLVAMLPRYVTPHWSFYDRPAWGRPRLASMYYQRTHAGLLRAFAHCEPEHAVTFREHAGRFEAQADRFIDRVRVLVAKRNDGALPSPATAVPVALESEDVVPESVPVVPVVSQPELVVPVLPVVSQVLEPVRRPASAELEEWSSR